MEKILDSKYVRALAALEKVALFVRARGAQRHYLAHPANYGTISMTGKLYQEIINILGRVE